MRSLTFLIIFSFSYLPIYAQEEFINYEKDTEWMKKLSSMNGADRNDANIEFTSDRFFQTYQTSIIKIDYNPILDKHINKYLSYKWLPKVIGLLEYYRPLFENKLKEYGLPFELILLPIVESNLNPQAKSPVGAMGLWQFMPGTGKQYGLTKNDKVNLFFDPYASTDSACQFLSYLYKELKDWNLVLAAYNSGLGRVQSALKKARTNNFWVVRQYLPQETQAYVPTFHAIKYIYKNYNFLYKSLPSLKYSFSSVKEVTVHKDTTFKELSQELRINLQTLYFLNPHLTSEFIPKNSFVYCL